MMNLWWYNSSSSNNNTNNNNDDDDYNDNKLMGVEFIEEIRLLQDKNSRLKSQLKIFFKFSVWHV